MRSLPTTWLALTLGLLTGCSDLNVFTVEDDIELGRQLRDEIARDPATYPLLDRAQYPEAYWHLDAIAASLLDTGVVDHRDDFAWEFHIVHDDEVLNAFAAPGGYVYVYTGLIHALDSEDAFAGVLGHEIAHAAERHSTQQLTRTYGLLTLSDFLLDGDAEIAGELATGLASLGFSRGHEHDADDHSVLYLCETPYAADGVARFFEDLEDAPIPAFLSTHPSSDNRVEEVTELARLRRCRTDPVESPYWRDFQDSLP